MAMKKKFDEPCQKKFEESFDRLHQTFRAVEEVVNGDREPWKRLVVISEDEGYLERTRKVFEGRRDVRVFTLKPSEDPAPALSEGVVTVFISTVNATMLELISRFKPKKLIAVAPEGNDRERMAALLMELDALLLERPVAPEYLRMAI